MTFTFEAYGIDDNGIVLQFRGPDGTVKILITDAELALVTTQPQMVNLVIAKLRRKVNREGIASKLDALIGQTVNV